jgi:hypothetical protein
MSRIFGKAKGKKIQSSQRFIQAMSILVTVAELIEMTRLANYIICQYKTDDGLFHKTDYVDYASTY